MENKKVCEIANQTSEIRRDEFGIVDSRGRAIGALVAVGEFDFVEAAHGNGGGRRYTTAPGHCFFFRPSATRNGKTYGAIQPQRVFAAVAERDAAIAKYLAAARKRVEKAALASVGITV